jgi:hypothetical protein
MGGRWDQQVLAHAFDLGAKIGELQAVPPVAAEQNDAAGERVFQAFAVGF